MPSKTWDYGDAYIRHPIAPGQVARFGNGSAVMVNNIFDPLPGFMCDADLLFVDPPWNLGNLNTFYTKAERDDKQTDFAEFYRRLFWCIGEIAPKTAYIEVGKEYLADFIQEARTLYRYVTFYNSSYYHKAQNMCYVIRGSHKRRTLPLDYMDEEDIIAWVCEHEEYSCIADPCIGRGLVAVGATKSGRAFVGTELNHKRLSVLIERVVTLGLTYSLEPAA